MRVLHNITSIVIGRFKQCNPLISNSAKVFKTYAGFHKHGLRHTEEGQLKCEDCDKRFAYKHQLEEHRRVHTDEKPFKCDFCGKASGRQSSNSERHTFEIYMALLT